MKNLPFLQELTEARLFYGAKDVKGMSAKEIGELIYLMIMLLEVVRWTKKSEASSYASKTMELSPYDTMFYSGTDLCNLLAVLNHQDVFAGQIKVDGKISIPLYQINRYLSTVRAGKGIESEDQQFFWRLEDYLKVYGNSAFRALRRDIGNWTNLAHADKVRITDALRREFDKRASQADLYLWFKTNFKLKESIDEAKKLSFPAAGTPRKVGEKKPRKSKLTIDEFTLRFIEDNASGVRELQHGLCEEYATAFMQEFGGEIWVTPEYEQPWGKFYHYFIRLGGKFYDGANTNGVKSWHELTTFKDYLKNFSFALAETWLPLFEEIDTKLAYNSELNPALWNENGDMHDDVKQALAKIANKFSEFVDIKQLKIVDYIVTGSNCNYNYTSQSDIDIHVLVDATGLGEGNPLTEPFLTAKKALWNSGHDITVKGFTVELYAEDVNKEENQLVATGVYSLMQDAWLKKPTHLDIDINDSAVAAKAEDIMNQIDAALESSNTDELNSIREHIRKMRRAGLEAGGEFSVENLAFKAIRNNGYFEKMNDFEKHEEDEELTLEDGQINEYELTPAHVAPRAVNEDDIDHDEFVKKELGDVDGHRVVHYNHIKTVITGFTFVTDKKTGATVGHIEHKMPSQHSRLAISLIRKNPAASFHMDNVLMLLISKGYVLESDTSNTENGAHKMLMRLAKRTPTHIEDGEGNVIPHNGDITSPENVALYTTRKTDKTFLDDNKHNHILVFGK